MAESVDAGDGFLSEVAAFFEGDGLIVAVDFLGEVVGGDVLAKPGETRGNAMLMEDLQVA